jgi:hypothetical protein
VFQRLPEKADLMVLVGKAPRSVRPFNKMYGIVEIETKCPLGLMKECSNSRRANDGEGFRIVHLSPEHEKSRDAKAVIGVEMADDNQLETAKTELSLLPGNLSGLTCVKKVDVTIEPHCQRCEQAIGRRHHTASAKENAVQDQTPRAAIPVKV